jgi:POT family proton-dependent oligopeptide transporter
MVPLGARIANPRSEDFLGHPKGVFVCFFIEMWRFFLLWQ